MRTPLLRNIIGTDRNIFTRFRGGGIMEEYSEDPLEVNLDDIEGKDPARARFIKDWIEGSQKARI